MFGGGGMGGMGGRREAKFSQRTINPDIRLACDIHIKDTVSLLFGLLFVYYIVYY